MTKILDRPGTKKILLIRGKNDLKFSIKHKSSWDAFVPSHHQLAFIAKRNNLMLMNIPDIISDDLYSDYTEQIATDIDSIKIILKDSLPAGLIAIIVGSLARDLYMVRLYATYANEFQTELFFRSRQKVLKPVLIPDDPKISYENSCKASSIPHEPYSLTFQSPSGLKTGIFNLPKNTIKLKFCDKKRLLFSKFPFQTDKTIYITVQRTSNKLNNVQWNKFDEYFSVDISQFLKLYIQQEILQYYSCYNALKSTFENNRLPTASYFNCIKDTQMAACISYFHDRGVPTKFQSHGGLHVFGNVSQIKICKAMSNSIYNYSPDASEIYLRSPLQKQFLPSTKNVKVKSVNIAETKPKNNTKFTILIALNFINWSDAAWGIHSTCYDTVKVLSHISKLVPLMRDIEWHLRMRFSIADKPRKNESRKLQGLDVIEVQRMFEDYENFRDVSLESYDNCLKNADLVIAEGVSAVPFDAWERLTPVLFMRASNQVRGLLRAEEKNELLFDQRNAFYSGNIQNVGVDEIYKISRLHWNRPLTELEVKNVLKVD